MLNFSKGTKMSYRWIVFALVLMIQACGGEQNDHAIIEPTDISTPAPAPDVAEPISLKVIPSFVDLNFNEAAQVSAVVVYEDGIEDPVEVTLTASNESLISVSGQTIEANSMSGLTDVIASYQTDSGVTLFSQLLVKVKSGNENEVLGIELSSYTVSLEVGESKQLTTYAYYGDGRRETVTAKYTVKESTVAEVTNDNIKGLSEGLTSLITLYDAPNGRTYEKEAAVLVKHSVDTQPKIIGIETVPTELTLQAGDNKTIRAFSVFSDGTNEEILQVTSSVANPEVASVNGLTVTAKDIQKSTVINFHYTASNGEQFEVETPLTVVKSGITTNTILGLRVTPNVIITESGSSTPLKAELFYIDGSAKEVTATWNISDTRVAEVSGTNLIANGNSGNATLTATYTDVDTGFIYSQTIAVAVLAESVKASDIIGLIVTPSFLLIDSGETVSIIGEVIKGDGTTETVSLDLESQDPAIASVSSADSTVTGVAQSGATIITASYTSDGKTFRKEVFTSILDKALSANEYVSLKVNPSTLFLQQGAKATLDTYAVQADGQEVAVTATIQVTDTSLATSSGNEITASTTNSGVSSVLVQYLTDDARLLSYNVPLMVFADTISENDVIGITASPILVLLNIGDKKTLTVSEVYGDGTLKDVSSSAVYSIDSTAIATVTNRVVSGVSSGQTTLNISHVIASGETKKTEVLVVVQPASLVSLDVTECEAQYPQGTNFNCKVDAFYSNGAKLDISHVVGISSSNEAVISSNSVDRDFKAVSQGSAELFFQWGGVSTTKPVTVTPPDVVSLIVNHETLKIPVGFTDNLQTWAIYSDGSRVDVTNTATYSSNAISIVTVDSSGVITAVAPGRTSLDVSYSGVSIDNPIDVEVQDKLLQDITLNPSSVSLPVGYSKNLTITAQFADGTSTDISDKATLSGDLNLVDISGDTVTGKAGGIASIHASYGGVTSTSPAVITVTTAVLQRIEIEPENAIVPIGFTQKHRATGYFDDASSVDLSNNVIWNTSDPSILSSESFGSYRGEAIGSAIVTAVDPQSSLSGTTTDIVDDKTVVELVPVPPIVYLPAGLSRQLELTAKWSDGSESLANAIVWYEKSDTPTNTSDTNVSTLGIDGVLNTYASGIAEYYGEFGGVESPIITVIVTKPGVYGITVEAIDLDNDGNPDDTIPVGNSTSVVVTADYSDGSTLDVSNSSNTSCKSSNPAIAQIDNFKAVTGVSVGTATISCSYEGFQQSVNITVTPAIATSITVTANKTSLVIPETLTLTVMGAFSDGTNRDISADSSYLITANTSTNGTYDVLNRDSTTPQIYQWYADNVGSATITVTTPDSVTNNGILTDTITVTSTFERYWYWEGMTYTWGNDTNFDPANASRACPATYGYWNDSVSRWRLMAQTILPGPRFNLTSITYWNATEGREGAGNRVRFMQGGTNGVDVYTGALTDLYYQTNARVTCYKSGRNF